jgi:hypothetical protein
MTGRILLLAGLILISTSLFSQNPGQRKGFGRDDFPLMDRFGKTSAEVVHEKQDLFWLQSNKKKPPQNVSANIYGKITLDSLVSENKFKADYKYNQAGDITLCIRYTGDNQYRYWLPGSKCELKYDTDRREIQYSTFWWRKETNEWIEDQREEKNYNISGELKKKITYYQSDYTDYSSPLVAGYIDEYAYDTKGKIILNTFYMRERTTGLMVNYGKTEYFYDLNGNPVQRISYNKNQDTGQWDAYWKVEYSYDEFGNNSTTNVYSLNENTNKFMLKYKYESEYIASAKQTQFVYSEWDNATGLLIYSYKSETSYDANLKTNQRISSIWNDTVSQYVYSDKEEYAWDANGNTAMETGFKWDKINGTWLNESKSEYSYDSHGNPNVEKNYVLDGSSGQLRPLSEYNYTYDISHSASELILPPVAISDRFGSGYLYTGQGEDIGNKLIEYQRYEWDETKKELVVSSKTKYYYSDLNNSSILDPGNITLYPNPVYDYLVIRYYDITAQVNFRLFDIRGKEIFSGLVANGEAFNVQNLSSGVYIFEITYPNKRQRGKLIKIHR